MDERDDGKPSGSVRHSDLVPLLAEKTINAPPSGQRKYVQTGRGLRPDGSAGSTHPPGPLGTVGEDDEEYLG